jgi:hypothetical protein
MTKRTAYQQALAKWRVENEEKTRMTTEDFFEGGPFDFCKIDNRVNVDLFQKCKVFLERNGRVGSGGGSGKGSQGGRRSEVGAERRAEKENGEGREREVFQEKMEAIDKALLQREIELKKQGKYWKR